MTLYYFDLKDGVPQRDRNGLDMPSPGAAIDHSKQIARAIRDERLMPDARLVVIVIDETGTEIHREQVYRDLAS